VLVLRGADDRVVARGLLLAGGEGGVVLGRKLGELGGESNGGCSWDHWREQELSRTFALVLPLEVTAQGLVVPLDRLKRIVGDTVSHQRRGRPEE